MEIIPFKRVGNLKFNDSYKLIKEVLSKYEIVEDILEVNDKRYPRIYVKDLDLMINFNEDSNSIRFFEFFKDSKNVFYNDLDLFSETYYLIEKEVKKQDSELNIEESGFESEKLGFVVSRLLDDNDYTNKIESLLIGSKSYFSESEIDLNDLYKSFMGEDLPEGID